MAFHGLTKTPRVPQVYGERIFIPEPLSRTLVDVLSPYTAIYNTSHYCALLADLHISVSSQVPNHFVPHCWIYVC